MRLLAASPAVAALLAGSSVALWSLPPDDKAADVHAVVSRAQQRIEQADFRAIGHLVRVDAGGKRTSVPIAIKAHWFPGVLRVLCEINSEAASRVHILLEMHPGGQASIQLAHPGDKAPVALPFEQWGDGPLGPGFSYEDFLEPQYFWPGQALLKQTKYGARDCDLLKSTPAPSSRTGYAQVQSWLDHTIGYPVYVEKTSRATSAVKEFTYFGLRQNGGIWSASQVEARIRGQNGSTLLIIERGSPKAHLELRDFSPEQLVRF